MIIHFRKWWLRIQFFVLLVLLSIVAYWLYQAIIDWIQPSERYKEPSGHAVKVVNPMDEMNLEPDSMMDRLRFFYWYGE